MIKKKNKLLIVEDEAVNIEIYRELLGSEYLLSIAEDGKKAVEIIETDAPDLVLLDMLLPDSHGVTLCKKFKENETLRHIPIIVVTSLDNTENKINALEAGANDYLSKPIDRSELLLKVKNHLTTKNLTDELNDSFQNIISINNISDAISSDFDPNYFDFNKNLYHLLHDYTSQIKNKDELPAYIMTCVKGKDNVLDSILYIVEERGPRNISDYLSIDNFDNYTVSEGSIEKDVSFKNRDGLDDTFEAFQLRFHPQVREQIGKIYNYISYHGKEVYVIAFNYKKPVNRFMAQVLKSFALNGNFFKLINDQINEVKGAYIYALNSLARAAEARDEMTGVHIIRVNYYSRYIARQLNLPDRMIRDIFNSAQMHDIGKVHVHPDILQKTGKLNEEEWVQITLHPAYGARILGDSEYMKVARNICLGHHENFDGSGYPLGIKGDEIPIEARIVHLADVYDSLRSRRSYKPPFSHKKAAEIILEGDDRVQPGHFDPEVLDVFRKNHLEFSKIYGQLTDSYNGNYENSREEREGGAKKKVPQITRIDTD